MDTEQLRTTETDTAAAALLALAATGPTSISADRLQASAVVPDGNGGLRALDLEIFSSRPRRIRGTTTVHDADGFVAYLAKHGLTQTEVYADVQRASLVAVVNAHEDIALALSDEADVDACTADEWAGWGDHRVQLSLRKTPAWTAWEAIDRKMLDQVDFAEHVEERLVDFREPAGADMLELAQTFNAKRSARFESGHRLATGETQVEYREETKAAAGQKGQLTIPDEVVLGLVPFEGCDAYRVVARLRYRLVDGGLRLGVVLTRPEDILRSAFLDIVTHVAEHTDRTIINGVPAAPLSR